MRRGREKKKRGGGGGGGGGGEKVTKTISWGESDRKLALSHLCISEFLV